MLTMLSAFPQLDRAFILARTQEGRERARAQGRRFGRKPKLNEQQIEHVRHEKGEACGKSALCLAATPQRYRAPYKFNNKKRRK
jgi:DNA invertase Pin-like site-specific DNA recombinase